MNDRAIPQLPSRSVSASVAFYRQLGFEGEVHAHGDYAIVTRGTLELHFFTHAELDPANSAACCYLRVANVDEVHRAFSAVGLPARGIPRCDPLGIKPWGMKEFAIVDPDGNLLRIGQPLS